MLTKVADFPYLLAAMVPAFGLLLNIATHIALFRLRIMPQLKSIVSGFIGGMFSVFVLTFVFCSTLDDLNFSSQLFLNSASYATLGYCYFHFVNLGETARRIRIIREIAESGKSGLTETEILQRYNARNMVQVRLKRLLNNGQIVERNERYYLEGSPLMKIIASIILFLKIFLLDKKNELE